MRRRNFQLKRRLGQRTKKTFALNASMSIGPLPQVKPSLQPSGWRQAFFRGHRSARSIQVQEFQLGMNLLAAAKQTQFEEGQVL